MNNEETKMKKIGMPDVPEERYWRQRREALSFRKKVLTSIQEEDLDDFFFVCDGYIVSGTLEELVEVPSAILLITKKDGVKTLRDLAEIEDFDIDGYQKDIKNIDMDEETNIGDLPISGYLFEDENEAMAWAKQEEEYERRKDEKGIVKKIMEL